MGCCGTACRKRPCRSRHCKCTVELQKAGQRTMLDTAHLLRMPMKPALLLAPTSPPQVPASPLSPPPEAGTRSADELLFLLAHELRNPVHAMCAALDVLEAATPGSGGAS